jgi:hypothetical protein
MSNTAATTIQRCFRGWKVRQELPMIRATHYEDNAGEGLGHKTLMKDPTSPIFSSQIFIDWLNGSRSMNRCCHEIWAQDLSQIQTVTHSFMRPQVRNGQHISFNDKTLETSSCRVNVVSGETNFAPLGDSPSWTFAKVVDAHYGDKGLWKFVKDDQEENLKVDQLFKDTISRLESGEKVSLWDGHSTRILPSTAHISKVKTAHVKFRYFANIEPKETHSVFVDDLEKRLEALKQSHSQPLLPLSSPKTICGVKCVSPLEKRVDDLEERIQRLLNLPNDVVYATCI